MTNDKKPFWSTLPGILTGIAAIITALGGVLAILVQLKVIDFNRSDPDPKPNHSQTEQGFRVVEVMLRADPFNHRGPCPVTIKFTGRISVIGGSGVVSYKFLRSDGASAPIQTLTFNGPGSQTVETTWGPLGAPGMTFSGWQALKILEPQEMESEKARFEIRCE